MSAKRRQIASKHSSGDESSKLLKRQTTIYDAIAGRVSSYGLGSELSSSTEYRNILASSAPPFHPEEVLFRRKNAPQRYEVPDFYWADRKLSSDQSLPDSDLAKVIHVYAAQFYSRSTLDRGEGDWKSLDETALLAVAILLEEASRYILGRNGHLVFVEGREEEESSDRFKTKAIIPAGALSIRSTSLAAKKSGETRKGKKRKLDKTGRVASEE